MILLQNFNGRMNNTSIKRKMSVLRNLRWCSTYWVKHRQSPIHIIRLRFVDKFFPTLRFSTHEGWGNSLYQENTNAIWEIVSNYFSSAILNSETSVKDWSTKEKCSGSGTEPAPSSSRDNVLSVELNQDNPQQTLFTWVLLPSLSHYVFHLTWKMRHFIKPPIHHKE